LTGAAEIVSSGAISITAIVEVSQRPSGGMAAHDFKSMFRKQVIEEDKEILAIIEMFLKDVA